MSLALRARTYAWNLAVATDMWANALLAGRPGQTISSRAYRASLKGRRWGCILCAWLARLQPDHCAKAFAAEEAAAELIVGMAARS